ncbi:MAG TPA: sigma-70 family RNA polymerase sigma factor [Planctomycetaceae bacterium]|nr:sigma-70 family RNA polymerase sigma factor [Planctomycetaceae bacterium]
MDASWVLRIQQARDGDTFVLGELFESFRNYLTVLARIQMRSRLQEKVCETDIVQQAFVRAFQGFSEFRGATQEELSAWLRQILASTVANQIRHCAETASRQITLEKQLQVEFNRSSDRLDPAFLAREKSPSSHFCRQEHALILADALEQLSPEYRDVILARYFENLTFPEIAQRMNRSEDSVQKLWWRGLAKLRLMLSVLEAHV